MLQGTTTLVTGRETGRGAAWTIGGRRTPQGCVCDVKSADSRLAVVEVNKHNISVEVNIRSWRAKRANHMNDDAVVEGVNEDNGPPEITA